MAMNEDEPETPKRACLAFVGQRCIASGTLTEVAREARRILDKDANAGVIVLDATTSDFIEVDLRGTSDEVAARLQPDPAAAPREHHPSPGRPRLGVVAREVTLLPRHWEWLSLQPGGASAALRRLVEEARRSTVGQTRVRLAREACYRFMTIMAGNEPGCEEALRALFAGDRERFNAQSDEWPTDVRDHARRLATASFADAPRDKAVER